MCAIAILYQEAGKGTTLWKGLNTLRIFYNLDKQVTKKFMVRATKKQKGFVKDYLETGIASVAVKKHYNVKNDETARSIGSENLTKPNIQALIESYAEKATENIYELANNAKGEPVKLAANKDILDRAGYKPVDRSESKNINLTIDATKRESIKQLASKVLKELKDGNKPT